MLKLKFKVTLYFSKTGNVFETYICNTRKEAEKIVRERKLEFKNWDKDEIRPNGVQKNWVYI